MAAAPLAERMPTSPTITGLPRRAAKRVDARDHAVDRRPMRRPVVVGAERRIERDADGVEPVPKRHLLGTLDIMRDVKQRTGKYRA